MVAYSFKPLFIDAILAGQKTQTIRAVGRRRHAHIGDQLQIYTGMRTRHCRLVGRARCIGVDQVRMNLAEDLVVLRSTQAPTEPIRIWTDDGLEAFARRDGFSAELYGSAWEALKRFWAQNHRGVSIFEGLAFDWGDTLEPA